MKVGDRIPTWFSGEKDGKSTIVSIHPYPEGKNRIFTHYLVLTAPRCAKGTLEMSVNEADVDREINN